MSILAVCRKKAVDGSNAKPSEFESRFPVLERNGAALTNGPTDGTNLLRMWRDGLSILATDAHDKSAPNEAALRQLATLFTDQVSVTNRQRPRYTAPPLELPAQRIPAGVEDSIPNKAASDQRSEVYRDLRP